MVRPLSLAQHTLYADLLDQGADHLFDPEMAENGSILVRPNRAGAQASHAYYQGYRPAAGRTDRGKRYARYLGRADDPVVAAKIARFRRVKAVRSERATTVRALIAAGLPRPSSVAGWIIEAVARAGPFSEQTVLIGTYAYETYSSVLGVRLSKATCASAAGELSVMLAARSVESIPGLLEVLRTVDPSFAPTPSDKPDGSRFRSTSGAQVTVIAAGSDDTDDVVGLTQFLVTQPVKAIVLHGPGIPITVPAPERFAVHAVAAAGQHGSAATDVSELLEAICIADRERSLAAALAEARRNGPTWLKNLEIGIQAMPLTAREILSRIA